jgi:hypothetical protein
MSYTNADGLKVLTDGAAGVAATDGVTVVGVRKALIVELNDATALVDTYSSASSATAAFIPANALIVSAHFVVDTAFTSGGAATLDIGLFNAAGTAIDADGIDADIALAAMAADYAVVCNGVLADGTQNVGAANAYVGFSYETAAFTAGSGKLVIEYIEVL